jgi:hypothetical protein
VRKAVRPGEKRFPERGSRFFVKPPVFLSGNMEGADEHNRQWVEKYKERIPILIGDSQQ